LKPRGFEPLFRAYWALQATRDRALSTAPRSGTAASG
jgi:hypothetical protein